MSFPWQSRKVTVTGGASFIGSTLVDALLARGASVRVVDDFSSGVKQNIQHLVDDGSVELLQGNLLDPDVSRRAVQGQDTVFHLAADHGGRGYVDLHQYACSTNLGLDAILFKNVVDAGVEQVVYASSGCIYPLYLQADVGETLYLTEDMEKAPGYDPDGLYGLAKIAAELTLRAMHNEFGIKTASARYFTVYGPRGVENHAVIAMIARAFLKQDPFNVWGNGEQIRNWTYVQDIVEGTIRCAEHIEDGTAVNLGTMERVRVLDAVKMVCDLAGYDPEIVLQTDMPTGPMNRVADNSLAKKLLGWEPEVLFEEGLRRTFDWYNSTKDVDEVRAIFDFMLTERGAPTARGGVRGIGELTVPIVAAADGTLLPRLERRCRERLDGSTVNGVRIDGLTPEDYVDILATFLSCGHSHVVHFCAAHPTVEARKDEGYRALLNRGSLNVPDGMPVAWALRMSGGETERLAGTEGVHLAASWGVENGLRHYLYGGTPETLVRLQQQLEATYPGILIVGAESPPFRAISEEERRESVRRMQQSGAQAVWVGLGAPKQDIVASELRSMRAAPVILCVGAAFDFVAGDLKRAPLWMRRSGLEWVHRLAADPRRLWRRYLVGNSQFVMGVALDWVRDRRRHNPSA